MHGPGPVLGGVDVGLHAGDGPALAADEFLGENGNGVAPDVEVEMTPKAVIAGSDPQLEKAVEIVLEELAQNPLPPVSRPKPAERV